MTVSELRERLSRILAEDPNLANVPVRIDMDAVESEDLHLQVQKQFPEITTLVISGMWKMRGPMGKL